MPIDPARVNAVGDLVLTDAREFRALADPLRLTLFDTVRRQGPVTSAELAETTKQAGGSLDDHLHALEAIGLIESESDGRGDVRWTAGAEGIYFEIPEDPEGQHAARELGNVMLAKYATLPVAWIRDEEPRLALDWARAAGLFNARVALTTDELRRLQEELERLLEPFTTRAAADTPDGATPVRVLAYFMPEAAPENQSGG
jgi:predicted transcriptional regulator